MLTRAFAEDDVDDERSRAEGDGPAEPHGPHGPPLPAGLGELTPAREALVEFATIDVDLLGAAAAASAPLPRADGDDESLERWLRERSVEESRGVALLLLAGHGAEAERQPRRAWLASADRPDDRADPPRRSVAAIEAR